MFVELEASYGPVLINIKKIVIMRAAESGHGTRIIVDQQEVVVSENPKLVLAKIERVGKHTLNG